MQFAKKQIRISFLAAIWLCVTSPALLANETVSQHISWKPVANAGGYIVALRQKGGSLLWEQETDTAEFTFTLSEGDYEFRIGALNRFGKNPVYSLWMPLQVKLAKPPVVQTEPLPPGSPPTAPVAIEGKGFSQHIKVFLARGNNRTQVEKVTRKSENELEIVIPPNLAPGRYDLVLENPKSRNSVIENYLIILDTRKVVEGGQLAVLWRSALLPGWGQLHANNNLKGYLTATVFTAATMFYIYSEINFFSEERDYQNLRGDVYNPNFRRKLLSAQDSYAAAADLQNIAVFTLAGVYVLNLIDAALFNGPYSASELQTLMSPAAHRVTIAMKPDGAYFTVTHLLP